MINLSEIVHIIKTKDGYFVDFALEGSDDDYIFTNNVTEAYTFDTATSASTFAKRAKLEGEILTLKVDVTLVDSKKILEVEL